MCEAVRRFYFRKSFYVQITFLDRRKIKCRRNTLNFCIFAIAMYSVHNWHVVIFIIFRLAENYELITVSLNIFRKDMRLKFSIRSY